MWSRLTGRAKLPPDRFPIALDDALAPYHRMLSDHLGGREMLFLGLPGGPDINTLVAGLLAQDPKTLTGLLRAALHRLLWIEEGGFGWTLLRGGWRSALKSLARELLDRRLPHRADDLEDLVSLTARLQPFEWLPVLTLLGHVGRHAQSEGLSPGLREALEDLAVQLEDTAQTRQRRRERERVLELLGRDEGLPLVPGEPWSDAALSELNALEGERRAAWVALLRHARDAQGGKPSHRWLAQSLPLLERVGREEFARRVAGWLTLTEDAAHLTPPFQPSPAQEKALEDQERRWGAEARAASLGYYRIDFHRAVLQSFGANSDLMAGLAWMAGTCADADLCRALAVAAEAFYRTVPGLGIRSGRAGNACVHALGAAECPEGAAQLTRLKQRLKKPSMVSAVDQALHAASRRTGVSALDLEELSVPTYDLEPGGKLRIALDGAVGELDLSGLSPEWRWVTNEGRVLKGPPARTRRDHPQELKEAKRLEQEARKTLQAQKDRLDGLYLEGRSWPYPVWRERYLEHPLVQVLARRLIWRLSRGERSGSGFWWEGRLVDASGAPLDWVSDDVTVELWHPLHSTPEEVERWRVWLEERRVTQPFKQAHREVYPLTDAERATRTYSNRFAAHILRQHQLAALCRQKGWRYTLQGLWDNPSEPTASRMLPTMRERAEFWVEPVTDGAQASDAGVLLYVATDQVRFTGGDPSLPLDQVPPLIFSEVMRHVDLFVSVSSIGADPSWLDRGERPAYNGYWNEFSFGELTVAGENRRQVLERLVPRLRIADRCSFDSRFLVVRGDLRTYRIHLGSGNILMQPGNTYLCIVPDASQDSREGREPLYLPFEGDRTLSVILSKALLLADDAQIDDPSIRRQIRAGYG